MIQSSASRPSLLCLLPFSLSRSSPSWAANERHLRKPTEALSTVPPLRTCVLTLLTGSHPPQPYISRSQMGAAWETNCHRCELPQCLTLAEANNWHWTVFGGVAAPFPGHEAGGALLCECVLGSQQMAVLLYLGRQ